MVESLLVGGKVNVPSFAHGEDTAPPDCWLAAGAVSVGRRASGASSDELGLTDSWLG